MTQLINWTTSIFDFGIWLSDSASFCLKKYTPIPQFNIKRKQILLHHHRSAFYYVFKFHKDASIVFSNYKIYQAIFISDKIVQMRLNVEIQWATCLKTAQ